MGEQALRIVLAGAEEDPQRRRAKTIRLRGELEQALGRTGRAELEVDRSEGEEEGGKGDPITLGAIVLALVSSGAVTALVNKIFDHVKRERDEIEVKTQNGTSITVRAGDLEDERKRVAIEDTIRRAVAAAEGVT